MTHLIARDLITQSGHCNGVRNKMKGATNEAKVKVKAKGVETPVLLSERGKQPITLRIGRVKVNASKCPVTAECLEQQVYKNGEPDKSNGRDHQNDATTYPIAYEMPIVKPVAHVPIRFTL